MDLSQTTPKRGQAGSNWRKSDESWQFLYLCKWPRQWRLQAICAVLPMVGHRPRWFIFSSLGLLLLLYSIWKLRCIPQRWDIESDSFRAYTLFVLLYGNGIWKCFPENFKTSLTFVSTLRTKHRRLDTISNPFEFPQKAEMEIRRCHLTGREILTSLTSRFC